MRPPRDPGFQKKSVGEETASGPNGANQTLSAEGTPATRDEVLVALNELLEAERAGARVAMETVRAMSPSALATLVQEIHKDEVRWCSMLMRTIRAMEGTPSSATGAFWGKAMAIPDLE
mgnify:CR=1 FL=1